ncbi:MAG: TonB family protein [Opitutaceae bacterium]
MKIVPRIWIFVLAGIVLGAGSARASDFEPARIKHRDLPAFPAELLDLGVRDGSAVVAFDVNRAGTVDDCLAIACTDAGFARVAVAAVRRWTFDPAQIDGHPVGTTGRVAMHFQVRGPVVVSLNVNGLVAMRMYQIGHPDTGFSVVGPGELDRVPRALVTAEPAFSQHMATKGEVGEVRVDFYIDRTGAVRLPAVGPGVDPRLAALAIGALRKWKFERPTRRGRPVLVRASQVFEFRAAG